MNGHSICTRPLPLVDWLAKVKADHMVWRKRRLQAAILAGSAGMLLASLIWPPPPFLVWNMSPSAPMGLYLLSPSATITVGDMTVTRVPPTARKLAADRQYLPFNMPLVKQVAAIEGDTVCAIGPDITVNGKRTVGRKAHDGSGRKMPWWSGCAKLAKGELFLIARDQPEAFDGRYFGVTRARYVIGKAVHLCRS